MKNDLPNIEANQFFPGEMSQNYLKQYEIMKVEISLQKSVKVSRNDMRSSSVDNNNSQNNEKTGAQPGTSNQGRHGYFPLE